LAKKTKFKIDLNLDSIKVKSVTIDSNGDYHIYVSCTANSTLCNKCGNKTTKSHGQCDESIIEHLPIFDHRVFIHVKWPRFKCEKCDNDNSATSFKPKWVNDRTVSHGSLHDTMLRDILFKVDVTYYNI